MATNFTGRRTAALTFFVALATWATATWAQSTMGEPMAATLLCRPALASETASAKMIVSSTTLVCKPFAVRLRMGDGEMKVIGNAAAKPASGPDLSGALTPQQINAACARWIEQTFHVDRSP